MNEQVLVGKELVGDSWRALWEITWGWGEGRRSQFRSGGQPSVAPGPRGFLECTWALVVALCPCGADPCFLCFWIPTHNSFPFIFIPLFIVVSSDIFHPVVKIQAWICWKKIVQRESCELSFIWAKWGLQPGDGISDSFERLLWGGDRRSHDI